WCALIVPVCVGVMSYGFWVLATGSWPRGFAVKSKAFFALGLLGCLICCCGLATIHWGAGSGGSIGSMVGEPLVKCFGIGGGSFFSTVLLLLCLGLVVQVGTFELLNALAVYTLKTSVFCYRFGLRVLRQVDYYLFHDIGDDFRRWYRWVEEHLFNKRLKKVYKVLQRAERGEGKASKGAAKRTVRTRLKGNARK
ncbi:hypothetical protein OAO01_07110, partial [Oligoflexia bacterium]|nr:hypothetical protein [Oligoflexia bacterium]